MAFYYCDYDDDSYDDSGDGGFDDGASDDDQQDDDPAGQQDDEQDLDDDSYQDDQQTPLAGGQGGGGDGGDGDGGDGGDANDLDGGDAFNTAQFEPELPPDATEADYTDDDGQWTPDDYQASAERIFGQDEHFGETIDDQLADAGFQRHDDTGFLENFDKIAPGAGDSVRLFERDGQLHAFGFIPTAMMMLLQSQFPGILFDYMNVTVPPKGSIAPPQPLPAPYASVEPKPAIDLRPKCTPVGDQEQTSRCSAFAWTHAVELTRNLAGKPPARLSPSYSMLQFQRMQGDAQDYSYAHEGGSGTVSGPDPGNVLRESGTCRQDLWPDDSESPKAAEKLLAADAQQYKLEATPLPIDLEDVKKALSAGCPVHVGMNTGPAFGSVGRDGVISAAEPPSGRHGRHAMLLVGYNGNFYTAKNSWGPQWGDDGYCYIPKNVLAEAEAEFIAVLRPPDQQPPQPQQPQVERQAAREASRREPEPKPHKRSWWPW